MDNNIILRSQYGPRHAYMCFRAYADSEGPGQLLWIANIMVNSVSRSITTFYFVWFGFTLFARDIVGMGYKVLTPVANEVLYLKFTTVTLSDNY